MKPAWALGLLLLAGCSTAPPAPAPPPPTPARPLDVIPPPLSVPGLAASKDSCGAAEMQGLLGHLRTEAPVAVQPDRQRVACTTCPVALDDKPERLNFFFDAKTGRITEIRCG